MIKILVVDDAAFMRMTIKGILEKNGFKVVGEAEDGITAIKMYSEFKPDIVTMDITMPEMSGVDALKIIKRYDSKAKVVMVTAMGQESMVMDAVSHGAKAFIIKPFKEDHVIKTLKKVMAM